MIWWVSPLVMMIIWICFLGSCGLAYYFLKDHPVLDSRGWVIGIISCAIAIYSGVVLIVSGTY